MKNLRLLLLGSLRIVGMSALFSLICHSSSAAEQKADVGFISPGQIQTQTESQSSDVRDSERKQTELNKDFFAAAVNGELAKAENCLFKGAPIDFIYPVPADGRLNIGFQQWHRKTVLTFLAGRPNAIRSVGSLLDMKANPNLEDGHGDCPLKVALLSENFDMVRLLLKRGALPSSAVLERMASELTTIEMAIILSEGSGSPVLALASESQHRRAMDLSKKPEDLERKFTNLKRIENLLRSAALNRERVQIVKSFLSCSSDTKILHGSLPDVLAEIVNSYLRHDIDSEVEALELMELSSTGKCGFCSIL